MLTVRHRNIRVSNEKSMRKVRDCRADWSRCEILALPCHSVSDGPIKCEKGVYKSVKNTVTNVMV